MVNNTTAVDGENFALGENLAPLTEEIAIERFSATIIKLPVGKVAKAGQATKEAAKCWKQARTMPRSVPLLNMGRSIPAVRAWILAELGSGREQSIDSPRMLNVIMRGLQVLVDAPGPIGDEARAVLNDMERDRK